jgi:hypothetical protein
MSIKLGPYRSGAWGVGRRLVVRNIPLRNAMISAVSGCLLAIAGSALLPTTQLLPRVAGAEVAMSGVGTALLLVGLTILALGVRMRSERTYLTIDDGELRVRIGDDRGRHGEYQVRVEDVEQVGVEAIDDGLVPGYRAEIRLRGGASIPLGETLTSSRRHHERIADEIRGFLA